MKVSMWRTGYYEAEKVVSPLAGYCPQFLLEQYEFEQAGILWKVVD